jgi:hypothetical protein
MCPAHDVCCQKPSNIYFARFCPEGPGPNCGFLKISLITLQPVPELLPSRTDLGPENFQIKKTKITRKPLILSGFFATKKV